jgi:hypothetical protein
VHVSTHLTRRPASAVLLDAEIGEIQEITAAPALEYVVFGNRIAQNGELSEPQPLLALTVNSLGGELHLTYSTGEAAERVGRFEGRIVCHGIFGQRSPFPGTVVHKIYRRVARPGDVPHPDGR